MSVNHGANLYDLSSKYGFSKDEFMDFSSNINPFGTSNKAKEYIINNINMVYKFKKIYIYILWVFKQKYSFRKWSYRINFIIYKNYKP